MQILRFEDDETPVLKKKRSTKGILVIAAAAVFFGVGTAFASSTININGGAGVTLGQGVSRVTGCDETMTVATAAGLLTATEPAPSPSSSATPVAAPKPTFYLNTLKLSNIDSTPTRGDGTGCGNKFLKIQLFYTVDVAGAKTETARTCTEMNAPATIPSSNNSANSKYTCKDGAIYLQIPATSLADYQDTITFPNTLNADLDYVAIMSTDSAA